MKLFQKLFALLLSCVLIFSSTFAEASGIKIKIGGTSSTQSTEESGDTEDGDSAVDEASSSSTDEQSETAEEDAEEEVPSAPTDTPDSEEEFRLSADFKSIKGENVRYYFEGGFSFAYLEENTYLKHIRHTDDTLEAETFVDGIYSRIWLPTNSVVLAVSVIEVGGTKKLVSELDPDYAEKIKEGKILATAGKDNPLLNTKKLKDVQTLLTDALNYDHTGLKLEPNATAGGGKKNTTTSTSSTKKTTNNKTMVIGVKTSSSTGGGKSKLVENPITAIVQKQAQASIFEKASNSSTSLADPEKDAEIKVHSFGSAFSYVSFGDVEGYMQTNALKFDSIIDFVIVNDKTKKTTLREEPSTKGKKIVDFSNGTVLAVFEEDGDFYKVATNGKEGYVAKASTKIISLASSVSMIAKIKNKANARGADIKNAPLVDQLTKGATVTIVDEMGDWTLVELANGKTAYVESSYLELQ